MQWTGKVAIVTGAGGTGCGRAIACHYARERAAVVLADINEEGLRATANAIATTVPLMSLKRRKSAR